MISILVTDYIQKRRGQALLSLLNIISYQIWYQMLTPTWIRHVVVFFELTQNTKCVGIFTDPCLEALTWNQNYVVLRQGFKTKKGESLELSRNSLSVFNNSILAGIKTISGSNFISIKRHWAIELMLCFWVPSHIYSATNAKPSFFIMVKNYYLKWQIWYC